MPDFSALEQALQRFRRELLRGERLVASEMVGAYGAAWRRIKGELNRLDAEYWALRETGQQPGQAWIYQFGRLRSLQNQIERELSAYAQYVGEAVRKEQEVAIYNAELHAERLVKGALGRMPAGVTIPWNRIPTGAVIEVVGATQVGSPLYQLLAEIAPRGAQAAIDALIQGLMLGKSPRETAREMRTALGGELWRSLRIARTETLRAYREATRLSYKANENIVKGWIWHSALDQRTCAACWAMHGTEHTNDELLDDHPNGRCAMLPVMRSWVEIGEMYGVDLSHVSETNTAVESGGVLFGRLSQEQQIGVLGPAKWAAWRDGLITFDDHPRTGIVGRTYNPVWGSMRVERSLRGILGADEAMKYTRLALMGVAQRSGEYTADDLIRIVGIGVRDLTAEELKRVIAHVASVGFDSNIFERAGGRIAGMSWNGRVLKGSDLLSPGEAHYLRHVVAQGEWPEGTTLSEYYQSLERVVLDENSRILVSQVGDEWQVGFLRENQPGMQYTYTWVDYRVSTGHWVTGFMTNDFDEILHNPRRTEKRWVR